MEDNKKIDFLAIGDIANDVFIKISEAETICDYDKAHCELCLNYGGKIPYTESVICHAVGNSSNFSIGTSRLGAKSILLTNLGDDDGGTLCIQKLQKENINTALVNKEDNMLTNYHYVLWYKNEHTILVKHEKYKYELPKNLEDVCTPSWVYLSSLGENSLSFHNQILEYLENNKDIKFAFQPGTFQIRFGLDTLLGIYKRTDILFCNLEEAQKILDTEITYIEELLKMIYNIGPKIVVITNGSRGSYAYDGKEIYSEGIKQASSLVETTGAGDAFASAFMVSINEGKDIKTALKWGSINSSSVVSHIGPHEGLLSKSEIEKILSFSL